MSKKREAQNIPNTSEQKNYTPTTTSDPGYHQNNYQPETGTGENTSPPPKPSDD